MSKEKSREYDRIAGSRISKMGGGIPLHVALSNKKSIIFRNKMKRLGLDKNDHVRELTALIDEIGIQENLSQMPLGVRFATVKTERKKPKIWKPS